MYDCTIQLFMGLQPNESFADVRRDVSTLLHHCASIKHLEHVKSHRNGRPTPEDEKDLLVHLYSWTNEIASKYSLKVTMVTPDPDPDGGDSPTAYLALVEPTDIHDEFKVVEKL